MMLLVTGAAGFLGRHVVAEALRAGHRVRALVRSAAAKGLPPAEPGRLEVVRADLRSPRGLDEALKGVDAVLHLAAAKDGDLYRHLADTVAATETLLRAMARTGVDRIVAVSSFSVYDYYRLSDGSALNERTLLEPRPFERDAYGCAKRFQEELVRKHALRDGLKLTVLRPGVIYGRDNLLSARLGIRLSERLWIRIGGGGQLPLSYVENCAEVIVRCAERSETVGETLNVIDDRPPTQRQYVRQLRRRLPAPPRMIPVPWFAMQALAGCADLVNRTLFGGRLKLPGILVPARLHARNKPLRFGNERLKRVLDWSPRFSLEEALERSLAEKPS